MDTCSICLNDIDIDSLCDTDCEHSFCYECLHKWLEIKQDCPYCRKKIENFKYKDEINRIIYVNNDVDVEDIENINQRIDSIRDMYENAANYRDSYNNLKISFKFLSTISLLFMGSTVFFAINCK